MTGIGSLSPEFQTRQRKIDRALPLAGCPNAGGRIEAGQIYNNTRQLAKMKKSGRTGQLESLVTSRLAETKHKRPQHLHRLLSGRQTAGKSSDREDRQAYRHLCGKGNAVGRIEPRDGMGMIEDFRASGHALEQFLRLTFKFETGVLVGLVARERRDPLHEVKDGLRRVMFLGQNRIDDLAGLHFRKAAAP